MKTKIFILTVLLSISRTVLVSQTNKSLDNPENHFIRQFAMDYDSSGFIWMFEEQLKMGETVGTYSNELGLSQGYELRLVKSWVDETIGLEHNRYQLYYKGLMVQGSEWSEHGEKGYVKLSNGHIVEGLSANPEMAINENDALEALRAAILPKVVYWQDTAFVAQLLQENPSFSQVALPKGELLIALVNDGKLKLDNYRMAWKFVITTTKPNYETIEYYVDALTGIIINKINLANNNGPGVTQYNGTQQLDTEWFGGFVQRFVLKATDDGRCIETSNDGSQVSDTDDNWTGDIEAVTAHWSVNRAYDYFKLVHSREGTDRNKKRIIVWSTNSSFELNNASYTRVYGEFLGITTANHDFIKFGKNSTNQRTMASLDIAAHEYTHGVTKHTANLIYQNESGALNESFSDIFGKAAEHWHQNNPASNNWTIGLEIDGVGLRSMSAPETFRYTDENGVTRPYPTTFLGPDWVTSSSFDYGGVHYNSSIQNRWFFLYQSEIGERDAVRVAYYSLTNLLQSAANHYDARSASMAAARLLFGSCSRQEYLAGLHWRNVGVGHAPDRLCIANRQYCIDQLPIRYTAVDVMQSGGPFYWGNIPSTWRTNRIGSNGQTLEITFVPAPVRPLWRPTSASINVSNRRNAWTTYTVSVADCNISGGRKNGTEHLPALELYPNPGTGDVFIEMDNLGMEVEQDIDVCFYDLTGRQVHNERLPYSPRSLVDISNLPSGIYFYRIQVDKQTYQGKYIKQ